jgi:DNA end-binding protein Ku
MWTGSLSFGLVNVPVRLVSANRDMGVHFRQIREADMVPIEIRRFCAKEDAEVPWEEIGHGYELKNGKEVVLSDDELESVAPEKTRTIDIEEFVDVGEIDPLHYDHHYFLVPEGSEGAARAYRLLVKAMEGEERAAIGRFVLRTKEYLVAIRVRDGALALSTLLFADEIRPAEEFGKPAAGKKLAPAKKEVDQAVKLIESMSCDWDAGRYEDEHRKRLLELIKQKGKGVELDIPDADEAAEPEPVSDLMAALEKSLAATR